MPANLRRASRRGVASVLETLAQMQVGTLERSGLDEETYLLIRLAALVATEAAPSAYHAHLGAAADVGLPIAKVLGTLVAVAPIAGSARVLSAASELLRAGLLPSEDRQITPSV
jgi:alkylhydroperoxidase/carboxymuconolactone decarboxylase family protein YurZ